jgi:SPP1 family predicted phage head-tail adaptor
MIDAGQLRERITVEQPTESRNRLGETTYTYSTFAEVWASVTGVTAREFLLANTQQTEITHRIRMRYLTGLTNQMRISWRGRTLQIISVLERENRSEHELICSETV